MPIQTYYGLNIWTGPDQASVAMSDGTNSNNLDAAAGHVWQSVTGTAGELLMLTVNAVSPTATSATYQATAPAALLTLSSAGVIQIFTAPQGTAGTQLTWTPVAFSTAPTRTRIRQSMAHHYLTANQSIPSSGAAFTQLTGFTTRFDTDGIFNATTNQWIAPIAGKYLFITGIQWITVTSTGSRLVRLSVNGGASTFPLLQLPAPAGDFMQMNASIILPLNASDAVDLEVEQDSGIPVTVNSGAGTFLNMLYVGE